MRLRWLLPVLLGLAVLAAPAPAAESAAPVARLIAQLGSQEFADRDKASRELEALGPAVLEPLRQAAGSDDPEVRRRAADLVRRLEARLLSEKMLAPTRVRLTYRDVPLRTALEDLERRTGLRLALHDPENKLAERRLTLDTGDVPLWEAFDEFCRKAGLAEAGSAEARPTPVAGAGRPAVGMIPAGAQGALPVVIPAPPPPGVPAVQAAQIQIQIQVGGQAPTVANVPSRALPGPAALALVEGKPPSLPAQFAGAVRVRALPPDTAAAGGPRHDDELPVVLELFPEPKLAWRGVLAVRVDRAIDDQGQQLARASSALNVGPRAHLPVAFAPTTVGIHRAYTSLPAPSEQVTVRLRKGEEPSKRLRELSGTILAQVQTEPEALMTVEKVLQSSGRTVKGDRGGLVRVIKAERADNGFLTLRVQVENPPDVVPATLRGRGTAAPADSSPSAALAAGTMGPYAAGAYGLNLLDDKGDPLPLIPVQAELANGASLVSEYTLLSQPQAGRGCPDRLIYAGTRTVTIGIPFSLEDVPLP